jgi:rfaE bifunctional protein nucleotidyltransferase chain/domain
MKKNKVLDFAEAAKVLDAERQAGKRIVQCHGTFDLVHPGHIVHLEEARSLGDLLVVTVTDERNVNKGPGRPCFNDSLRARTLAALECVDYVVLIPFPAAVEAIRLVKPAIYCKGTEYEDASTDVTGNIHDDLREVGSHGGEVRYIGSVVFSSSKLINRHFDHLPESVRQFCSALSSRTTAADIREMVDGFEKLRVLVVGDTIIDQYACLKVQGLTSKNRIISGRFLSQETYLGGAMAIARHVMEFTPHVRFVSLLGTEPWVDELLAGALPGSADATIRDESFTTVVKKRYVEPLLEGNEISKLFSVNFLNDGPPPDPVQERVLAALRREMANCDAVLLADFGHGMMQEKIREVVQNEAPFLILNCQTNSHNHGFNIITRQYRRADAFSLDNQEMMLSCGTRHFDPDKELAAMAALFGAGSAWFTRGNVMTHGFAKNSPPVHIPPLVTDVTDTVGAGDAFFSVAGLAAASRLSVEISTFLGQLAGAQAVNIVGNERPISKAALLKGVQSLLNL